MADFSPRLKEFMQELQAEWGVGGRLATYDAMGDRLGIPKGTISKLMSGIIPRRVSVLSMADQAKLPRTDFLIASGYIPTEEDYQNDLKNFGLFAPDEDELLKSLRTFGTVLNHHHVPVLGSVPCGPPDYREQVNGVDLLQKLHADYILEVEGNSMAEMFEHGDLIVVRHSNTPIFDKPNILLIDDMSQCKIVKDVKRGAKGINYVLASKDGTDETFEVEEERLRFQGVVVAKINGF